MARPFLKLGTRGSPLALTQTAEVRRSLAAAHHIAESEIEVVVIRTTGDMIQDRALSEAGGKGLFTKELDQALMDGSIDAAVHSSKDLPTYFPEALAIAGYLTREDPRDVLISSRAKTIAGLPPNATFGSASLRRQAMARRLRPDLTVTLLRGNVETRLRKAEEGEIDATILALAGLKRLGLAHRATTILETNEFLPAVGQGAVGITVRDEDHSTRVKLGAILDADTLYALTAERAFLTVLDGSCRTPIGGYAQVQNNRLILRGMILKKDGSEFFEISDEGALDDAHLIGTRAGRTLLDRAPNDFMS